MQIGYKGDAFGEFHETTTGHPVLMDALKAAGYHSSRTANDDLCIPSKVFRTFPFHKVFVKYGRWSCNWTNIVRVY